jgi:hypothetical protein
MKLFGRKAAGTSPTEAPLAASRGGAHIELRFASTAALERNLDGSEERFAAYYFAIYRCSPDESEAGINAYRENLRQTFPGKSMEVGKRYILVGEPAHLALRAYYRALAAAETLSDDYRQYARERIDVIATIHSESQSLKIDLTEGQLAQDHRMEFLACLAVMHRQIFPATDV